MKDRIKHGKNCATLTGLIRIELTEHIKPNMKTATDSFFDIKLAGLFKSAYAENAKPFI